MKLSDFGISKELDSSTAMSHTSVGTFRYMSPERLLGEKYDASGDIWSLGITIIELWTKKYPFSGVADTPIELISEFENGQIDKAYPRSVFPREMRNVVKSMLQFYPERRATCPQLATDPWFEVCGINNLNDAQMVS